MPHDPPHILVRGVNWLGDAVMTTPALRRLRQRFPQTQITLLTHEKLADLWQGHPCLDQVMSFKSGESPWSVASRIRKAFSTRPQVAGPSLALIFPNSPRSALEAWLARIPRRVGYAAGWRSFLLTDAVAPRPGQVRMRKRSAGEIKRRIAQPSSLVTGHSPPLAHQIHDYLHLIAEFGADSQPVPPELHISTEETRQAEEALVSEGLGQVKLVNQDLSPIFLGINPGAEYGPAKRWPAENFADAAVEISRRVPGSIWLLFGKQNDKPLCEFIAFEVGDRAVNLAGKTSLRQLMALLKLCRVLLTNDSGPMHVSAALGTPVVALFGSTSPDLTGPGLTGQNPNHVLQSGPPCSPCFRRECPIDFRCMTSISVAQVVKAVLSIL